MQTIPYLSLLIFRCNCSKMSHPTSLSLCLFIKQVYSAVFDDFFFYLGFPSSRVRCSQTIRYLQIKFQFYFERWSLSMEQAIVIIFEITSLPFITFYLTSSLSSRNWYYRFWRSVRNLYLPVIIETLFSYRFLLALYHFLIAFLLILPCSSSSESISTFSGFSLFFFAGIR